MGLKHPQFLAATQVWGCHKCRTHLAVGESLVSTVSRCASPPAWCPTPGFAASLCVARRRCSHSPGAQKFNGQTGRAYLFDQVVNITCGDPEDRHMTTGMHTVRDICCERCGCTLGWKYVSGR
jgi:hypothetical protein